MWVYLARRVAVMVPVFFRATLLIHTVVFLLPGIRSPRSAATANETRCGGPTARAVPPRPALLAAVRALPPGGILRGDFGVSFRSAHQCGSGTGDFPVTIRLALVALAVKRCSVSGSVCSPGCAAADGSTPPPLLASLVVIAVPVFVLGFLAQFLFGVDGASPGDGRGPGQLRAAAAARHRAGVGVVRLLRLTRSAVAETAEPTGYAPPRPTSASRSRVVSMHPAQLADRSSRSWARIWARCSAARRHRGHLQHPRRRRCALPAVTRQEAPPSSAS